MIISRRTSFTNLECPNPFEDPEWDDFDNIPNKTLVASAMAEGTKVVTYRVPDGASGWYALKVIPDSGSYTASTLYGSWAYTYLHEGSVVFLWAGSHSAPALNQRTGTTYNSLGGSTVFANGGAVGILCGFKKSENIDDNNYGPYLIAPPHKVVDGPVSFKKLTITVDSRIIERYILDEISVLGENPSSYATGMYMLIDGKPCLTFEDPRAMYSLGSHTIGAAEEFDGIYLASTPVEISDCAFCAVSGLIIGESYVNQGGGAGGLGSSGRFCGPTLSFGYSGGEVYNGSAFFDFGRDVYDSNARSFSVAYDSSIIGAYLYKVTETGHDTTEPYGQKFTAPEAVTGGNFSFFINGDEYHFPDEWIGANRQDEGTVYETFIPGCHIGDSLQVVATYDNETTANALYEITTHSLVYGLTFKKNEFLWVESGDYTVKLAPGTYQMYVHGAGGAGGANGGSFNNTNGGVGGRGGNGSLTLYTVTFNDITDVDVHVGEAGLTYANGGNGGAGGAAGGNGAPAAGAGGGGGKPSIVSINGTYYVGNGGGGGGGGGGAATNNRRYDNGGASGGGGGHYIVNSSGVIIPQSGRAGNAATSSERSGAAGTDGYTTVPVYSGAGGRGAWASLQGGARAYGAGASGGAGGGGPGNDNTSAGGSGGGGAGGCLDAGGGANARNTLYNNFNTTVAAYNAGLTTPTPSVNYLGEKVLSGWGIGGTSNMNGTDGWVYVVRCEEVTAIIDAGYVMTYAPDSSDDAGTILSGVTESDDAGLVDGNVESSDDAGYLMSSVPVETTWDLGLITDDITATKNCGHIIGEF